MPITTCLPCAIMVMAWAITWLTSCGKRLALCSLVVARLEALASECATCCAWLYAFFEMRTVARSILGVMTQPVSSKSAAPLHV